MSEVRQAIIADIDRTVITNSILPKSWKCPHCGQRQKMNPFGDETLIEFGNHISDESNTGYSAESDDTFMVDCIAWMPLPEPWKGDEK